MHQLLELEQMLWLDGFPTFTSHFWLLVQLRFGQRSRHACSLLRVLERFLEVFSEILKHFYSTLDILLADSFVHLRIVAGLG